MIGSDRVFQDHVSTELNLWGRLFLIDSLNKVRFANPEKSLDTFEDWYRLAIERIDPYHVDGDPTLRIDPYLPKEWAVGQAAREGKVFVVSFNVPQRIRRPLEYLRRRFNRPPNMELSMTWMAKQAEGNACPNPTNETEAFSPNFETGVISIFFGVYRKGVQAMWWFPVDEGKIDLGALEDSFLPYSEMTRRQEVTPLPTYIN